MNKLIAALLFFMIANNTFAQKANEDLVQFSGVVVTNDSLQPIPYTSVIIKHAYRGTLTDFYGFFSFVVMLLLLFQSNNKSKYNCTSYL